MIEEMKFVPKGSGTLEKGLWWTGQEVGFYGSLALKEIHVNLTFLRLPFPYIHNSPII